MRNETRERIGGPFAFGAILYLVGAPLSIGSHLVFFEGRSISLGPTLLSSTIGYLAMGVAWWLLNLSVFRKRGSVPIPVVWVVIVAFITGAMRSGIASIVAVEFGARQSWDVWVSRTISGGLIASVMVPIGAYLLASIFHYQESRARLVSQKVSLQAARLESEAAGRALCEVVTAAANERIAIAIAPVLESLDQQGVSGTVVASELRHGSAGHIRQVAHDMWKDQPNPTIRTSAGQWLGVAQISFISLPLVTGIWLLSALNVQWTRAGPVWGTVAALISTAVVAVGIAVGRTLGLRVPRGGWFVFWFIAIVTAMFGSILVSLIPGIGLNRMLIDFPIAVIWLGFLVVTIAVIRGALLHSAEVLDLLDNNIDEEKLRLASAEQLRINLERRTAQLIHAQVQGRVHGVITLLEQESAPDTEWVRHELENLRIRGDHDATPIELDEGLRSLINSWNGFMSIEVMNEVESVSDLTARSIQGVVAEALTNAFRHGRAQHVFVHIAREDDVFRVTVTDDGMGSVRSESANKGIGSNIFDQATGGQWVLGSIEPHGCVLSALIGGTNAPNS